MIILDKLRHRYTVPVDPLKTERRVELITAALLAVLCLQLIYSGIKLALASGPAPIAPAADALSLESLQRTREVAATQSSEIRARPLFWSSRRPVDAVPEVAEPEPDPNRVEAGELKGVKLQGIFGSGDTAGIIALVKDKKQRILIGEQLKGWTLDSVSPNRIVLVDGGRRQELVLKAGVIVAAKPAVTKSSGGSTDGTPPVSGKQKIEASKEPGRVVAPPSPRGLKR